jgi:hypothetical protein
VTAEQQDLPWWTSEELEAVATIDELILATSGYTPDTQPWHLPLRLQQQQRDEDDNTIKWNLTKQISATTNT